MVRDELRTASNELREAAEAASGEAKDRIYEQSNQLATLATRDQDPDHGRLDRHMHALAELMDETDGEIHDHIETAREAVRSYREGVPGV
jgi:gas vesicle protein